MDIHKYWEVTLKQNRKSMREFFHSEALVRFHNTKEEFTVDEFIEVNCDYPNLWNGEIERIAIVEDTIISVVHVFALEKPWSFHVTSFMKLRENKILLIDEYWGENGEIPIWRLDKKIGKRILSKD